MAPVFLAVVMGLSGRAACQTVRVTGMPDFDQRRAGLANDGNAHCVPTASINMLAYIANHGFPAMMDGPRSWQSQAQHDFVSGNIFIMGALMGTTGTGGTSGVGWEVGLREWLDDHAPGLFTLTRLYATGGVHAVTPQTMFNALDQGSLVALAYGRYTRPQKFEPPYERTGGHAVTLEVVTLSTTPGLLGSVQYRDPATGDGNLNTQSTFSTRIALLRNGTIPLTNGTTRTMWEMLFEPPPPISTRRFVDQMVIVDPAFALTPGINSILVHRPRLLFGSPAQAMRSIAHPPGPRAVRAIVNPCGISATVATQSAPGVPARLWHLSLADGTYDQLLNLPANDTPYALSRHTGEIYAPNVDGALIHYSTVIGPNGDRSLQPGGSHRPPSAIGAVTYSDDTDQPIILLPAVRQLLFYPRTLGTPTIRPLIGTFTLAGEMSMVVGPCGSPVAQKVFIRAGNNIYQFGQVVDGYQREETITPPAAGGAVTGFCLTDMGTMLVAQGGQLNEYQRMPGGGWSMLPGSAFTGLPAGDDIDISRSRSNYDAAIPGIPGWELIVDDVAGTETPDCPPDFNHDGVVNSQDFFEYLVAFFTGDFAAEFNSDAIVNSQDFFDFLAAFFAGC